MDISQVTNAIEELAGQVSIIDIIVCAAGVSVLVAWLLRTSFGTKALVESPVRRNDMLPHLALIPLFFWFLTVGLLGFIKGKAFGELPGWQDALADNLVMLLGTVPAVVTSLVIARRHFARRLKGFGLNPKTIIRDLIAALPNLLAIMPVVLAVVVLTSLTGKLIVGPGFEMPRHEELKLIMAYPQWQVRVMIIFTTILVVPAAEEMLFRGMFQTVFRSYIIRPWPAVIFASLIFVVFHENPQHWPALFALSLCLGYAYEKSGSLFRPIFIHSIFNALSVFAALGQ